MTAKATHNLNLSVMVRSPEEWDHVYAELMAMAGVFGMVLAGVHVSSYLVDDEEGPQEPQDLSQEKSEREEIWPLEMQARTAAVQAYNDYFVDRFPPVDTGDAHLVWFAKTLKNWKALVYVPSNNKPIYFEVTHDGDAQSTYVDAYEKLFNVEAY